ncbi:Carbonic anhydrase 14 [Larimichthys crocea]|uniref:Uncharacterized protein n=1 Tax=Larimichthys crocea TaxID=215358 RepID=A0ACD3QVZ7_LARCR|nr:Carbonic anhydrase 14 [Larimichthys crocea]
MDSLGLFILLLLLCFQWTAAPAAEEVTWTYTGLVGQSEWSQYFPNCGGNSQSPVDVVTTQTKYDPSLIPLTPVGYSQHGNRPFTLYNNGHTAVIELPEWMGLAGFPWLFTAVQMHLHWGSGGPSHGGSEHTINGLSADAEIRRCSSQALTSSLCFPNDLGRYYRYNGSLTTPPCYQSVIWTLFHERVQISKAQLLKMETILYSSKAEEPDRMLLQDNYRSTQPLNHRVVFASFSAESWKELSSGEVTAIVIGVMCGCVGLAVIIRFIVKTIRIKEPEKAKEKKQEVALNMTPEGEKKEEPSQSPQTEP